MPYENKSYINVTKEKVILNTKSNWVVIEINILKGIRRFSINSLLPTTYYLARTDEKIVIVNFNRVWENTIDLFGYVGLFNPDTIRIVDKEYNVETCIIKDSKETWKFQVNTWSDDKGKIFKNKNFNGDNRYKTKTYYLRDENSKTKKLKKVQKRELAYKKLPKDSLKKYITGFISKGELSDSESGGPYAGEYYMDIRNNKTYAGKPEIGKNQEIGLKIKRRTNGQPKS